MVRKLLLIIVINSTCVSCLIGNVLQLDARLSSNRIAKNQSVQYEVTVSGKKLPDDLTVQLSDLSGKFDVVYLGDGYAFSMVNGQISKSKTKKYRLAPLKTGRFTIGPAKVTWEKKDYFSNSVALSVVTQNQQVVSPTTPGRVTEVFPDFFGGAQQSSFNERDYRLVATANKTTVYVGEKIIYSLRYLGRTKVSGRPSVPDFQGFLTEDIEVSNQYYLTSINGQRVYAYDVLKKELLPLAPGNVILNSAQLRFQLNSFDRVRTIYSDPIQFQVLLLPEADKPSDFSGTVGDFFLTLLETEVSFTQGQPTSLFLELTGAGNLQGVLDLHYEESTAVKIYKAGVTTEPSTEDPTKIVRKFEYIVIPNDAGNIQLPSFSLSYFSPTEITYKQTVVPAMSLSVAASDLVANFVTEPQKEELTVLQSDIHYLKEIPQQSFRYMIAHPAVWLLIILNLVIMVYRIGLWASRYLIKTDIQAATRKKAYGVAIRQIKQLESGTEKEVPHTQLYNILMTFLSQKLKVSLREKSHLQVAQILTQAGLSQQGVDKVKQAVDKLTFFAYSPMASGETEKKSLYAQVYDALKHVEGERV